MCTTRSDDYDAACSLVHTSKAVQRESKTGSEGSVAMRKSYAETSEQNPRSARQRWYGMDSKRSLRKNIYLIGDTDSQINGNKLPSRRQVIKVFFFNHNELKLTIRESAKLTVKEVKPFWEKARIPTQKEDRCIKKVENLFGEWKKIQKNVRRRSNKQKEKDFTSKLNDLFDIAHGNAFRMIDETEKEFLMNQRKPGRICYIGNIKTTKHTEKEITCSNQEEIKIQQRLEKNDNEETIVFGKNVELASSDDGLFRDLIQTSLGTYSNVTTEGFDIVLADQDTAGPSEPKNSRTH